MRCERREDVSDRAVVYVLPVVHGVVADLWNTGRASGSGYGVDVNVGRNVPAQFDGEVVDDGTTVGWQVSDATLIAAADEADLLQLDEVAAHGALRLSGVVGKPMLRGGGTAAGGVGVVGETDQDGDERGRQAGGVRECPRDGFDAHVDVPATVVVFPAVCMRTADVETSRMGAARVRGLGHAERRVKRRGSMGGQTDAQGLQAGEQG
ncbi:hypothetical protein GCM10027610_070660 [Dactylosporangium cerinum]